MDHSYNYRIMAQLVSNHRVRKWLPKARQHFSNPCSPILNPRERGVRWASFRVHLEYIWSGMRILRKEARDIGFTNEQLFSCCRGCFDFLAVGRIAMWMFVATIMEECVCWNGVEEGPQLGPSTLELVEQAESVIRDRWQGWKRDEMASSDESGHWVLFLKGRSLPRGG